MKIFLDANILFSAANRKSRVGQLVDRLHRDHSLVSSDYAFEEAIRNIRLKRKEWETGFEEIASFIEVLGSVDQEIPVSLAGKDRPILATAIKARCDYLLAGDHRDFGHLYGRKIASVTIVSTTGMGEILLSAFHEKRG